MEENYPKLHLFHWFWSLRFNVSEPIPNDILHNSKQKYSSSRIAICNCHSFRFKILEILKLFISFTLKILSSNAWKLMDKLLICADFTQTFSAKYKASLLLHLLLYNYYIIYLVECWTKYIELYFILKYQIIIFPFKSQVKTVKSVDKL